MSIILEVLFGLLAAGMVAAVAFLFTADKRGRGIFSLYAMITAALTLGGIQKHLTAILVGLLLGFLLVVGEKIFLQWRTKK